MHFDLHPKFYTFTFRRKPEHAEPGRDKDVFKPISVFTDNSGEFFCVMHSMQTKLIREYRLTDLVVCTEPE